MFFKNTFQSEAQDQKGSREYRQVFLPKGPAILVVSFLPFFVPRGLRPAQKERYALKPQEKLGKYEKRLAATSSSRSHKVILHVRLSVVCFFLTFFSLFS